jgi:hypothetical protein
VPLKCYLTSVCRALLHNSIDEPWTTIEPLRVGLVPEGQGTPRGLVTVERDGLPYMRIDAYAEHDGPFSEVVVWDIFIVLGWSDVVHVIDPVSRRVKSIRCGGYFGHLYPYDGHLLIASASELLCLNRGAEEVWRRQNLGIDGVVVDRVTEGVIFGQGEWDPPGGWRPFQLELETGEPVAR